MAANVVKDLVDQYIARYNAHDVDGVIELFAPDAVHEDIAQGRGKTGIEAIGKGLQGFYGAFPDSQWEPRAVMCGDGSAAIEYTLTGTHSGPLGSMPPTGKRITLRGVFVLAIRDGRIVRCSDYWDAKTFQKQLTPT